MDKDKMIADLMKDIKKQDKKIEDIRKGIAKLKLVKALKKYFACYDGVFRPMYIADCNEWNNMMNELGITLKDWY